MKVIRNIMLSLATLQLALAVLIALTSSFADGGRTWDRILLGTVQPVAAGLLFLMVWKAHSLTKQLKYAAVALLLVNVVGNITIAVSISSGAIKGDWFLPVVFAIVPTVGIIYGLTLRTRTDLATDT